MYDTINRKHLKINLRKIRRLCAEKTNTQEKSKAQ